MAGWKSIRAFYEDRRVQTGFMIASFLLWMGLLTYTYTKAARAYAAKDGSFEKLPPVAQAFYFFAIHRTWATFKCWFAALTNEPALDIWMTFVFAFLPMPFIPWSVQSRIEVALSKIGLYKIMVYFILGESHYPTPCIPQPST